MVVDAKIVKPPTPFTAVPCRCGGGICGLRKEDKYGRCEPRKRRFKCTDCKRWVPWCFGADDNAWRSCDDCWTPEIQQHSKFLGAA